MASSWFPLFGRDYLAATMGWTAEERGHYTVLLITQWEQGGIPDDLKRLELITPGITKAWKTIAPKFPKSTDGLRKNTRLEHERHLSHERSERARQSASARWNKATAQTTNPGLTAESDDSECERICERICPDDASMTMSYSPPPPPPPPPVGDEGEDGTAWSTLREAWNANWGDKRAWRSTEPPPEAIARLREPGWLAEALSAIPEIKRGACSGWKTPPTLRQFCGRDPSRGSFVSRLLGGEFVDPERSPSFASKRREPTAVGE